MDRGPFRGSVVRSGSLAVAALLVAVLIAKAGRADDQTAIDFSRDIRPIFSNTCFKCHGPDEGTREADLRLDTPEAAFAERDGYRAIDARHAAESAVLKRIMSTDESERMPPVDSGLKLTQPQIELIRKWIEQGAHYDVHWSFRPMRRPAVPKLNSTWMRNNVDAFILQRLNQQKLEPSPEADRHTLIRRVYLDVLGLPPTPEQVDEFLADDSPGAYERMVDRALASTHYGERWGRHWLDQARYADTNGYSVDSERAMWPYRDWVIQAVNSDLPFDLFTIDQLAGDLLPSPTRDQLVATGFHRNTLINEEGGTDPEQFRVEAVVDRANTTGAVWLGLTVGCAQCHAHKFDPISQREYYQLFAFFNNCEDVNAAAPTISISSPEREAKLVELDAKLAEGKRKIAEQGLEKALEKASADQEATSKEREKRPKLVVEQLQLQRERDQVSKLLATMVMRERAEPRESHVLIRGDFLRTGEKVTPDTPAVLPPLAKSEKPHNRLDLARWVVSRQNPLTARVTVNRVWARYFGHGLVETENDFGVQGTPPTHPELLDWLALEFVDRGWSMKNLHRIILNSAAYRQSSRYRQDLAKGDPLNKLLGRQARLRVDAEIVRDVALSTSGLLHDKIGGPSVYPPQPADVYAFTQIARQWPTSTGPDRYRRGMYTFFKRSAPYPMLTTFDSPVFNSTCTFRQRSNTPLQSLTMANDEVMVEFARALGERIYRRQSTDQGRIDFAYRLCFSRPADEVEMKRLARYVDQQRESFVKTPQDAEEFAGKSSVKPVAEAAAWTALARVLLNLDEFVTRE
jgi:mono/diheme cytochrome c family protein